MNVDKEGIEEPAFTVQGGEDTKSKIEENSKWINILPIYQACMNQDQSIRTSYQSLLITLEVLLFTVLIAFQELKLGGYFWCLAIVGIFLCCGFGVACEYNARNVDIWRKRIVTLVSGTEVEDAFKEGKYRWIPFGKAGSRGEFLFGHVFERVLILAMLVAWLVVLWHFPIGLPRHTSLTIRLVSTFLFFSWGAYVFPFRFVDRLIESKAEYHDYGRVRRSKWFR